MLVGIALSAYGTILIEENSQVDCAQAALDTLSNEDQGKLLGQPPAPNGYRLNAYSLQRAELQKLGCSEWYETAAWILIPFSFGVSITFGVSIVLYGVIRAIGWVVGDRHL
jgi:hypothetical protein